MQGTRGSSPRRSTSLSPVAQWQSARPITGRPRFDTVRENQQPKQEVTMTTLKQTGRLAAAPRFADGPGAFKPETVGQRAFNPRARGSTPPGSPNTSSCTRLAQLVERRPLKSEVRGSSPRSCTNSPLACDASAEASPLSAGRDGLDSRAGRQLYQPPSKGGPRCLCPRIQRSCSTPTSGR